MGQPPRALPNASTILRLAVAGLRLGRHSDAATASRLSLLYLDDGFQEAAGFGDGLLLPMNADLVPF